MNVNFINLPGDIKSYIFSFNKDKEKHEYLLKKCINEVKILKKQSEKYFEWVYFCIGLSVSEHKSDYLYWVRMEFTDEKTQSYFLSKINIVKLILNDNTKKRICDSIWWDMH